MVCALAGGRADFCRTLTPRAEELCLGTGPGGLVSSRGSLALQGSLSPRDSAGCPLPNTFIFVRRCLLIKPSSFGPAGLRRGVGRFLGPAAGASCGCPVPAGARRRAPGSPADPWRWDPEPASPQPLQSSGLSLNPPASDEVVLLLQACGSCSPRVPASPESLEPPSDL